MPRKEILKDDDTICSKKEILKDDDTIHSKRKYLKMGHCMIKK